MRSGGGNDEDEGEDDGKKKELSQIERGEAFI